MSGLLGKIGGAINSPVGQGLLTAAGFGFNPLLGLLAAPSIASAREREEMRNAQAREEIRGKRQENDSEARKQTALRQMTGLLRSEPPQLLDPTSKTGGLLAQPQAEQTYGQREAAILSRAAPEKFAEGLLGQMFPQGDRAETSLVRNVRALQDPSLTDEQRALIRADIEGSGVSPQDQLAIFNLGRGQDEVRREAEERERARGLEEISVNETLSKGRNVISNAQKLERTFLEPGAFGIDARRPLSALAAEGMHMIGADRWANARRSEIKAYDSLVKDSTDIVIGLQKRFGTNPTNLQSKMLQDASAGIGISPAAIVSVTSELMERALREADVNGMTIQEREQIEAFLNESRGGEGIEQQGAQDLGGNQVDFMAKLAGLGERAGSAGRGLLGEGQRAFSSAADTTQNLAGQGVAAGRTAFSSAADIVASVVEQGPERVSTAGVSAMQALDSGTREQRTAAAALLESLMPHWESFKELTEEEKQKLTQRIERARSGR